MKAASTGSASLITAFLALSPALSSLVVATDKDGSTALHFAAASGHLDCALVLLQAGANPSARNAFSWAPIDYINTVSSEVEFRNIVAQLERGREEMLERDRVVERRREGGVRLVNEDDLEFGMDMARDVLANIDAGRTTPTGLRAQGWGLGGRLRAGSSD
jgi:hypothetical protein